MPIVESDQHVRVLHSQLTVNLGTFLVRAEEELRYSLETDVPRPQGKIPPRYGYVLADEILFKIGWKWISRKSCEPW